MIVSPTEGPGNPFEGRVPPPSLSSYPSRHQTQDGDIRHSKEIVPEGSTQFDFEHKKKSFRRDRLNLISSIKICEWHPPESVMVGDDI